MASPQHHPPVASSAPQEASRDPSPFCRSPIPEPSSEGAGRPGQGPEETQGTPK